MFRRVTIGIAGLAACVMTLAPTPRVHAAGLLSPAPLADPVQVLADTETGGADAAAASAGMSPKLKAMLLSLAVPGLGQYTSGNRGAAYAFFGLEAAIWATNIGLNLQGDSRSDRYEEFAGNWGDVADPTGHDDTYYTNLGRYPSYDEYRVVALQSGEGDLYGEDMRWTWPSEERRNRFLDLRAAAEDSYQNADFMFAAALINRALSMVHAARTVKNVQPAAGHSLRFDLRPEDGDLTPLLAWQYRF